jgi:hypothetical protein
MRSLGKVINEGLRALKPSVGIRVIESEGHPILRLFVEAELFGITFYLTVHIVFTR